MNKLAQLKLAVLHFLIKLDKLIESQFSIVFVVVVIIVFASKSIDRSILFFNYSFASSSSTFFFVTLINCIAEEERRIKRGKFPRILYINISNN